MPHVRYTDDICEFNRVTPTETKETKPIENGNRAISEEAEKGEQVTDSEEDFDNLTNIIDEIEQNKIIDEILEKENEDEVKNIPSDVEESTLSDFEETTHSDINGEVLGPDNQEDGLAHVAEENDKSEVPINEKDEEKLETNEDSEILEENDDNQTTEANETKTDDEVVNDTSVNEENGDENIENEAETISVPTNDYINEENGVNKSDDDTVVDGILGDGDNSDSINER